MAIDLKNLMADGAVMRRNGADPAGIVIADLADQLAALSSADLDALGTALAALTSFTATYQPLDGDLTALAAAGNSATLAATTASFLTADETKLDAIEALADVTDAANVSTAGGLIVVAYDAGWPARPTVSGPVMWVNQTNATAPTADVAGDIVLLNVA